MRCFQSKYRANRHLPGDQRYGLDECGNLYGFQSVHGADNHLSNDQPELDQYRCVHASQHQWQWRYGGVPDNQPELDERGDMYTGGHQWLRRYGAMSGIEQFRLGQCGDLYCFEPFFRTDHYLSDFVRYRDAKFGNMYRLSTNEWSGGYL
jgi:hypothetical protein